MFYKSVYGSFDTSGEGTISAAFAVFNMRDSDGDVTLPSFFTNGQKIPLVWSHDWSQPIGVGTIDVQQDKAVFNGELFLDTIDGREAYTKIKRMGDIQQYSFGYLVTDFDRGDFQGQPTRFLKAGETFEVSPVLVGANRATHTIAIKGHGLDFEQHTEQVRVALDEWVGRCNAGSELRVKEGRAISEHRRQQIADMATAMHGHADALMAMHAETAPKKEQPAEDVEEKAADVVDDAVRAERQRLRIEYLRLEARLHGVTV